jgi:protein TonB
MVSRIELTLQSIKSRPQHRVVAPPERFKPPEAYRDRQPSPQKMGRNSVITAPQYKPPEPVKAERLQKLPPVPQITDRSDPVAAVWEDAPEAVPVSVAPEPSPVKPDERLAEIKYIDHIKRQIDDAKEYPQRARRRNLEGVVKVLFTIDAGGELASISVSTSSGSRILDRSATKAVQKAAPFDPPPNGSLTLEVPIKYQLT